jgi:hypothetical protein
VRANFDETWFETVFAALDRLHDEVSAGDLRAISSMPAAAIVGWLEDVIYTAQETIVELRTTQAEIDDVTEADLVS